jgi:hypothetical protein
MRIMVKIALVTGALALACGSAALAAGKPEGVPPQGKGAANGAAGGNGSVYTPGESPHGPPAQAKAYGRYCKGESKKHVKGEKGTAFSRCVKNMAQAAKQESKAPGQICKGESKEHVKGEKGTAFSRCVKAVNKLRKEEREKEKEGS